MQICFGLVGHFLSEKVREKMLKDFYQKTVLQIKMLKPTEPQKQLHNLSKLLSGQCVYIAGLVNMYLKETRSSSFSFFKKKILFIFRGRGREGERERNINVQLPQEWPLLMILPATQACALIGNQTGNPLVHRPKLSPLSYTSQGYILLFLMEDSSFEFV